MNVLAIGAHFDDVELGCGGSLAKHIVNNDTVYIYVATDSAYGTYGGDEVRGMETARKEGQQSADLLGANLICGSQKTFMLAFDEKTDAAIVKIVEEKQIDCLYIHWIGDVHHDHFQLAKAAMHAARHVPRILMYRSNWYVSDESFREDFFVDISETWDIKKKMIMCHESECSRVGNAWIDYFDREALNNGLKIGVERAEAFQTVKWLI